MDKLSDDVKQLLEHKGNIVLSMDPVEYDQIRLDHENGNYRLTLSVYNNNHTLIVSQLRVYDGKPISNDDVVVVRRAGNLYLCKAKWLHMENIRCYDETPTDDCDSLFDPKNKVILSMDQKKYDDLKDPRDTPAKYARVPDLMNNGDRVYPVQDHFNICARMGYSQFFTEIVVSCNANNNTFAIVRREWLKVVTD